MTDPGQSDADAVDSAYQQAVRYGRDLARVYVAERAKREQLEIAYQLLNATYHVMPNGLIVLDSKLSVERSNEAFQRLVETDEAALIGMNIDTLLPVEVGQLIRRLSAGGQASDQVECTMLKPARRFLLATATRLESGSLSGWLVTIEDQSHRKRIEYQKAEFINIAAHELRTPLGQVLGYAEMLHDGVVENSDPTYASFVEAILAGSIRLSGIVNEIIQFATLNSGHMQPPGIAEFKLSDLIDALLTDLRPFQQQYQVEIQVAEIDPTLLLKSDATLLHGALYQLLLNGMIFNKPGGYVRLSAEAKNWQVLIDIADNGIGIAQTDLETVFQPFIQVEDHSIRSKNGLGLGLSIAQRSIESISGKLSVSSTLGKGTTFHIAIPRRIAPLT